MQRTDIFLVLGALAGGGLACTAKPATEATEVPAAGSQADAEANCRHELGRCGGHAPGDGACRSVAPSADATPTTPLQDVLVAPGKFAEINLVMAEGAAFAVTFEGVGGSLAWNIHSHDGDAVAIHAEGTGAADTLRFIAPRAGEFSVLWTNSGAAPVRVTARLVPEGAVRVESVHPSPK